MATIKPFTINVPKEQLDDLQARLKNTIWPGEVKDAGWSYGTKQSYVKDLVDHLLTKYDWRAEEAKLNKYPQFTTEIDGQNVHFFHVTSKEANATPLLMIHGWPGSVVEFVHLIDRLTDPVAHGGNAEDAFDVVIPSLPGFGFSGPTLESGWNNGRIGKAFNELMGILGYDHYGIQGGDAGAMIAPEMGRQNPDRIIGIHVNAATMGFIPMGPVDPAVVEKFTDVEKGRMQRLQQFMAEHFGFNALQSTRPQSLAFAIADSPAGLISWNSELFTNFGDRPNTVSKDDFLTNVMIYWVTNTSASAMRLYFENAHDPNAWTPKANSGVPTAVANFKEDVAIRTFGEQDNTIVRWTDFDEGGHYAVFELPDVFVSDVRTFFADVRSSK